MLNLEFMNHRLRFIHRALSSVNNNHWFHLAMGAGIIIYICWDSKIIWDEPSVHHGVIFYIALNQIQNILSAIGEVTEGLDED